MTASMAPTLAAPGQARGFVRAILTGTPATVIDNALVMVSELVTNSLRHSTSQNSGHVGVSVTTEDQTIRVEVSDAGPLPGNYPTVQTEMDENGGNGLRIVDGCSARWDVYTRGDGGTVVWFELDLPDGEV